MKHTIKTAAGALTVEPSTSIEGQVQVSVKPAIWPALTLTITPAEAELISQALYLSASEVTTRQAQIGQAL